jgi:predicted nucleic acid-binding protein
VIAPDTSVVVAALAPWHSAHRAAREALATRDRSLVAHVAFETTSALSRMPEGARLSARVVQSALDRMFPADWLQLDAVAARTALTTAVDAGVRGGALYDALIAATALSHGARLVSLDRRGLTAYDAIGADVELLAV